MHGMLWLNHLISWKMVCIIDVFALNIRYYKVIREFGYYDCRNFYLISFLSLNILFSGKKSAILLLEYKEEVFTKEKRTQRRKQVGYISKGTRKS